VTHRAIEHGLLSRDDGRRWLRDLANGQVFAAVTLFMIAASSQPEVRSLIWEPEGERGSE
jgi:hypothetical protein